MSFVIHLRRQILISLKNKGDIYKQELSRTLLIILPTMHKLNAQLPAICRFIFPAQSIPFFYKFNKFLLILEKSFKFMNSGLPILKIN